jgi:hypothetical protein
MDTMTFALSFAIVAAFVYLGRLVVRERGDFEAGGQAGRHKFFVKAKQKQ